MMTAHGENEMFARKPDNGMEGWKLTNQLGNNRRALREINNYVGAAPFPPAIGKRGLSEKPHLENKIKHFAGHRPVTRGYAASVANKQVHVEQSNCRPQVIRYEERLGMDLPVETSTDLENLVMEVDHDMVISNFPLPPYVKQTEEILEEGKDEMEEMEMENMDVEVPDIDRADKEDTLAVVEYVEEIYTYYRQAEASSCVSPDYMSNQSDINEKMRAILIDWLIEVHHKFELMDETLFLMVNLIDRFLERHQVVRKKLQLVGVTAMLLACKYEEVTVPIVEDLILISDRAYSRDEVLEMEKLIVNTLQFNMSVPTPYAFMRRFLKAAESDKKLELLSFFMIELCLVEYGMLNYPPSLLAASAVYTAQCTVNRFRYWSKASAWHTKYAEDQLLECSKLMVEFHKKSANGKLTGVYRKYSTAMLGYAAKAEPAEFLLNTRLQ